MTKLRSFSLKNLRSAENFVSRNKTLGAQGWVARWNGWKIETFVPHPGGEFDARGSFDRELGWGYTYIFSPNSNGHWNIRVPAGRSA